jgi:anaerobic carbon-monoxide dehydrogenase iron sulfur subunit
MLRINIDRNKCISCLTCVTACVVSHESSDSRNRVTIDSNSKSSPIFCRNCDFPECVYTCMTGAMYKNEKTGFVDYNKDQCASCYMCVMACPYGVLKSDRIEKKEIMKCNMCVHRTDDSSAKPMCVEKCPMQAITVEETKL